MVVIGSYALALLGLKPLGEVADLDLVGLPGDVARFRAANQAAIERERPEHGHRHVFYLKPGYGLARVEIDFEQSDSDRMLPALCPRRENVMGLDVAVPPVEVLYLIKRAHANVAIHYGKTIQDILRLKPLIGPLNEAQSGFYQARKRECQDRYQLHRQRFSLAIRNEDFFELSNHVRVYEHDDLHEAVAYEPGRPLYKRCKRDLSLARIDTDLFEQLGPQDRLRMVQEEFMVIGLERFYLHDRSLDARAVYEKGLHKTIRDLFVGYFQDFCIDHIDELIEPPPFDCVERFVTAEREGKLRPVNIDIPPPTDEHKKLWGLIQRGELNEARRAAEDLIRRASPPGDTHALFLLGVTQFEMKNFKLAEKCLRKCMARDRKNALARFYLGVICRMTARPADALRLFQQAEQAGIRTFGLYLNLGLAHEALSMNDEAMKAYRQAKSLKQEAPNLARRIAALDARMAARPH